MGVWIFVHREIISQTEQVAVCETEEQLQRITVLQLKEKIKQKFDLPPDLERIRLVFRGQQLSDDRCLPDYGIQKESVVYMIFRLGGAERTNQVQTTGQTDTRTDGPEMEVKIIVQSGEKLELDMRYSEEQLQRITIRQLKETIRQELGVSPKHICMIWINMEDIEDDDGTLSSYGVKHLSVIHVFMRLKGGGCPPELQPQPHGGVRGDRDGRRRSMEQLAGFHQGSGAVAASSSANLSVKVSLGGVCSLS